MDFRGRRSSSIDSNNRVSPDSGSKGLSEDSSAFLSDDLSDVDDSKVPIVLKNGLVLTERDDGTFTTVHADVVVIDSEIVHIGLAPYPEPVNERFRGISSVSFECEGKLIAPGFISTHNHLWQTQLKGRHGDDTQLDFIVKGNLQAAAYTDCDIYLGTLAACIEAMSCGITTVVDQAHCTVDEAMPLAALQAVIDSGIRCDFCYCPPPTVYIDQTRDGETILGNRSEVWPEWSKQQWDRLKQLSLPPRVRLGFGGDFLPTLPKDELETVLQGPLSGAKLITNHWIQHPTAASSEKARSFPATLSSLDATLIPPILLAHCNTSRPDELASLASSSASRHVAISSVPYAEVGLGIGHPQTIRKTGIPCSLGVGCHSIHAMEMWTPMRAALTLSRVADINPGTSAESTRKSPSTTCEDIYRLATTAGGAVLGMQGKIGSLRVGSKADIVAVDTETLNMSLAVQQDPVAALVNFASPREVSLLLVDGEVRLNFGMVSADRVDGVVLSEYERLIEEKTESAGPMSDGRQSPHQISPNLGAEHWWHGLEEGSRWREKVQLEKMLEALKVSRDNVNLKIQQVDVARLESHVVEVLGLQEDGQTWVKKAKPTIS
ncbi:Metallo-dependent hydrolase [Polychaeton citri CBS 116435]|uniref:Metallo-dependent hydrolase n=1 Tax=Polychaeton citri CBS 116435 TaxID=1314669 RepID=A0A9P4UTG2_9PEZI|nr:Metallo-dependent hydrolase [Polychaeton citri CBS 116435]